MAEHALTKARPGSRQAVPAAGEAFFAGGDRKTHLEQLRRLCQGSRRVLVVTGPRGVGKTTLYRQLCATLDPRIKAARINGALVNGAREVAGAVVQGFGLAAPADAGTRRLCALIGAHAAEQERSERCCVVLVDDADLLEARAMDVLLDMAAAQPLRLVLFGQVRLVSAVQRAAGASKLGWHEIRLTGFDVVDVRAYLEWWFRRRGYGSGLPFTDAQVKDIARLSEGLPGRVERMAEELLARLDATRQERRLRRFPAGHRALLAVLAVVLGFVYLVWEPAGSDGGGQRIEPLEVPISALDTPAVDEPRRSEEAGVAVAPAGEVTADATPGGEVPAGQVPAGQVPASQVPAGQVPPVTGVVAERAGAAAVPEPAATAAPAFRDAAWIMARPGSAYTVQLASFSSAERAAEYLARQERPEAFARFRQQQAGRILHVVIYGEFASRAAAEQAAARLPDGAGKVQPWIRPFSQIQDAVRTALQP